MPGICDLLDNHRGDMVAYLIITTFLLGVLILEAYVVDPWFWSRGRSDKPWSTLLYVGAILLVSLIEFATIGTCWPILYGFCARAAFDPILNTSRGLSICYHPDTNWYERFWRRFGCEAELALRVLWFTSGLIIRFIIF